MRFTFPVPAGSIVTQSFAEHVHRAKVNNWTNYNGGIDWAVSSGSPVLAAADGVVSAVRNDATGYGVHVRIQHDEGYLTIYAHLMDYNVRVGDKVKAGQVIGRSDNTGNSTGPHLHFELRKNNVAVDPAPLLSAETSVDASQREWQPGDRVSIAAGWNLRSGPGVDYARLSVAEMMIPATVQEINGKWYRVQSEFWVHRDAIQDS